MMKLINDYSPVKMDCGVNVAIYGYLIMVIVCEVYKIASFI